MDLYSERCKLRAGDRPTVRENGSAKGPLGGSHTHAVAFSRIVAPVGRDPSHDNAALQVPLCLSQENWDHKIHNPGAIGRTVRRHTSRN